MQLVQLPPSAVIATGEDLVMPRSLTSGSVPSQELRHFTNREQERHVLSRLLALPSGQPVPVVMFYGVGGTGKSWLLCRLLRRSTAGNPVGLARLRSTVRRRLRITPTIRGRWPSCGDSLPRSSARALMCPTAGCAFTRASGRIRFSRKMQKSAKNVSGIFYKTLVPKKVPYTLLLSSITSSSSSEAASSGT